MNEVVLNGVIRDITPSHVVEDTEYDKANFIVKNSNGKDSILNLRFKHFSNPYIDGDKCSLVGNIRSYSHKVEGKNKVDLYVFTYFNTPEEVVESNNAFTVDGRICKLNEVRTLGNGKHNIQFILANNIYKDGGMKLSSYLPCIAWGKLAYQISKLNVNDQVLIHGELRSREYKKWISETDFEFRVAHELIVFDIEKKEESSESLL